MKKQTLIILSLLLSLVGMGQKVEQMPIDFTYHGDTLWLARDSTPHPNITYWPYHKEPGDTINKFDTVRVLMLISDAARVRQYSGYEIRKKIGKYYSDTNSFDDVFILPTWHYSWIHFGYLDENKYPFNNYITVWMSK